MAKEQEVLLLPSAPSSFQYQDGYQDGWENSRIYFKTIFLAFFDGFVETDKIFLTKDEIEELFDNPEDEYWLLHKAALNHKGLP